MNFQNSLNSGQPGVGGDLQPAGAVLHPPHQRDSHSSATRQADRNRDRPGGRDCRGRGETTSTATTSPSCSADLPIRSTSALGTIVPKPRVAAIATVYAHEIGRNTAITRM